MGACLMLFFVLFLRVRLVSGGGGVGGPNANVGFKLSSITGVIFYGRRVSVGDLPIRSIRGYFSFLRTFTERGIVCNVGANFNPVTR